MGYILQRYAFSLRYIIVFFGSCFLLIVSVAFHLMVISDSALFTWTASLVYVLAVQWCVSVVSSFLSFAVSLSIRSLLSGGLETLALLLCFYCLSRMQNILEEFHPASFPCLFPSRLGLSLSCPSLLPFFLFFCITYHIFSPHLCLMWVVQ